MARFDAVLFDMDGTLVDSHASVERTWTTIAEELGLIAPELLRVCDGRPAPDTLRQVLPRATEEQITAVAHHQLELQYCDLGGVEPMPGWGELDDHLVRCSMRWAVVTSADRTLAMARLGQCGIAASVVVTADDVSRGEPDPEGYRRAGSIVAGLGDVDADTRIRTLAEVVDLVGAGHE